MSALDPARAAAGLLAVRARQPRVHCLTNHVARAFTANVLLAIGAVPSMSMDESEVGAFVSGADALLINLGTLDPPMRASIDIALDVAAASGLPIVIDPVFADRSEARADYARALIRRGPAALRCNHDEAGALGEAALSEAERAGAVIALTGQIDRIQGAGQIVDIRGGHALMTRVTAMGCALGAVIAAFLAAGEDRLEAVGSACLLFKQAGAAAGAGSSGPGSFVPAFLDALYQASESGQLPMGGKA
jgi:hydroxyethylthiazole kinase